MTDRAGWKALIADLATDAGFRPGASQASISQTEEAIGVPLPDPLRSLLLESDGVRADLGAEIIWSCAALAERNREFRLDKDFRELYMTFESLLFIGCDGGGNQFAFAIVAAGRIENPDIYRWDHETDAREWFASDLSDYLERRLSASYYERS